MGRAWIVLLLCLTVLGCVDARSRFDEFSERKDAQKERERVMGGMGRVLEGGCLMPARMQLAGQYLFAMSAKPSPDRPILALLTIEPRMKGDKLVGAVYFEPLAITDGMSTVGVKNSGTFELSGSVLTTPSFHVVLPGDANPVQPGLNAEADIVFKSDVCLDAPEQVKVFCGEAGGNITVPLNLPLAGSTFAAVRIEEGMPWPTALASCEQVAAK